MKEKILIFFMLFISAKMMTQTVTGRIADSENNPIYGVNILLKGHNKSTATNENGEFRIDGVKIGKHKIKASIDGYRSTEIPFIMEGRDIKLATTVLLSAEIYNIIDAVYIYGQKDRLTNVSQSLRLDTEIKKLPQNIQVVSSEIISDQMITNMLDVPSRNVSGVSNIEHWGNFARVASRGFRLPPLRNGINLADNYGPLSEDMFIVDKIEYVKGPAGFMMSAGEPGGFYNVVTKKPTLERVGRVSAMLGMYNHYRGAIDFGGKIGKSDRLLFRLNAMAQNKGTHREHQNDDERYGIAPSISYQISPETKVLVEFSHQKLKTYLGSAYVFVRKGDAYASLNRNFSMIDKSFPESNIDENYLLNRLTHKFNDKWTVEAQYSMVTYNQIGAFFRTNAMDDKGNHKGSADIWDTRSEGEYAQVYMNGKFATGGLHHKFLGSFDYSEKNYWGDFSQKKFLPTFNIFNPIYNDDAKPIEFDRSKSLKDRAKGQKGTHRSGSLVRTYYAQDEIGFLQDRLRLTLAGRYTELVTHSGKNPKKSQKLTPRFGISADITKQITAYALLDQSFLPNTPNPQDVKDGTEFKPITGTAYEGGIKSSWFNDKLRTTVGIYQITKTNLPIATTEINPATKRPFLAPDEKVTSKGFEIDVQGNVTHNLSIILNYANTNVKNSKDERLVGYATHIQNTWVTYDFNEGSFLKGFALSLGYQYLIDRSTWTLDKNKKSDLPDYFRLDGTLSWRNKKWAVGINVNNLLDTYLYSGQNISKRGEGNFWQSEPGTNAQLSLTYNIL